jgi:hypothetical protein
VTSMDGKLSSGHLPRVRTTRTRPTGLPVMPAPRAQTSTELDRQPELRPQPRADRSGHDKRDLEARSLNTGRGGLLLLDPRRIGRSTGSSSGAGIVPSSLLVGIAALAAFTIFAAPGLGRRIRVARELSPRGQDASPIDHPG